MIPKLQISAESRPDTRYILITPARNEEEYILSTIESVICQSIKPIKWAIVSDASDDKTDDIIQYYAALHHWIVYLRKDIRTVTGFASKVESFNLGLETIANEESAFIGNLDADICIKPDYYELILDEFYNKPTLGICGGRVFEKIGTTFRKRKSSVNSVAGAVQLFRKECFKQIGGYLPLKHGGIDSAAEIIARSKGWEVQTIADIHVTHNGPVITGSGSVLKRKFYQGITHYQLGYDPVFEISRQLYRWAEYPFILGAVSRLLGFFWAYLNRLDLILNDEALQYLRKEQAQRLKALIPFSDRQKPNRVKTIRIFH